MRFFRIVDDCDNGNEYGLRTKIMIGTIVSTLILSILNNMMNLMNVSPHLQGFVKGLIIIIAVVFQKRE